MSLQLLEEVISKANSASLESIGLKVLCKNGAAIATYRNAGFRKTHKLISYRLENAVNASREEPLEGIFINRI